MSAVSTKSQPSVPGSPDKPIVVNNHPNRLYFVLVLLGVACIGAYGVGVYAFGVHQAAWGAIGSFSQLTQVNALIVMFSGGAGTVFVIGVLYSVSNHIDKVDDAHTETLRKLQEKETENNQLKAAHEAEITNLENRNKKDVNALQILNQEFDLKNQELEAWVERHLKERGKFVSQNRACKKRLRELEAQNAALQASISIDNTFREKKKINDEITGSMIKINSNEELQKNICEILNNENIQSKEEKIELIVKAFKTHKYNDCLWESTEISEAEYKKFYIQKNGTRKFTEKSIEDQFKADLPRNKPKMIVSAPDYNFVKMQLMKHPLINGNKNDALKILASFNQGPLNFLHQNIYKANLQIMELLTITQQTPKNGEMTRMVQLDTSDRNNISITAWVNLELRTPEPCNVNGVIPARIEAIYAKGEDNKLYSKGFINWEFLPLPGLSTKE